MAYMNGIECAAHDADGVHFLFRCIFAAFSHMKLSVTGKPSRQCLRQ
jgi:hypothetical protein